jgi:hypothetical protein
MKVWPISPNSLRLPRFPLPPPRRFLQHPDRVEPARPGLGRVQWVLSRPLCRFRSFDLGHVPAAKRVQALRLELERWSPYPGSGYYIAWSGDTALVWCWDETRVHQALAEFRVNPNRLTVIPETLLYPSHPSGLRLVKCSEGYEGQFWDAYQLAHSRWWQAPPDASEWLAFQRDAGLPPDQQARPVPSPHILLLQARPWAQASGMDRYGQRLVLGERLSLALVTIALALPTLWYGLGIVKLDQVHERVATYLAQLEQTARPLLAARSQALDETARIHALQGLDPYPGQLALLAKVAETLPKTDVFIKEWNFQNGKLKLTLSSSGPLSNSYLVEAFQKAGYFDGVRAASSRDPRNLTLEMDVRALEKHV